MSISSVKNYVSGIRTLHKFLGLPFPPIDAFFPALFFKGLARTNPHYPHQKAPITPAILLSIHSILNFSDPSSHSFWAACLLAFFSFARKSNLFPPNLKAFNKDPSKHLTRGNIQICSYGLLLTFVWSKTIQSGGRALHIPICSIPNSILCPLRAYTNMLTLFPAPATSPAFLVLSPTLPAPLFQSAFVAKLRSSLALLDLPPLSFSGHSFRRGGASWAFQCGVPGELVKLLGDWKSDAYLGYLHTPLKDRISVSKAMTQNL